MIGILGLGLMGKIIAKDLYKNQKDKVVYIVRDIKSIKELAKKYNAEIRYGDVNNRRSLIQAFKGLSIVIHAVHHEYNINVMKACLKTNSHYIDLGGLYYYTKKQLKLNKEFKKKNLIAIIGIGASPGITNVMAKYASKYFDRINDIQIKIGVSDFSTYKQKSPLSSSYSIQTIIEEFSWKPVVFKNGRILFTEPCSSHEEHNFSDPVGKKQLQYAIHSEIATLPYTLNSKNVSFKISFDPEFANKIKELRELGFLSEKEISVKGIKFKPKNALLQVLKKLPGNIPQRIKQSEIIRVIVYGVKDGKINSKVMDAKIDTTDETIDKDTGVPPSIIVDMILNDKITKRGVYPPESVVPEVEFFNELAKRNILIYENNHRIN